MTRPLGEAFQQDQDTEYLTCLDIITQYHIVHADFSGNTRFAVIGCAELITTTEVDDTAGASFQIREEADGSTKDANPRDVYLLARAIIESAKT